MTTHCVTFSDNSMRQSRSLCLKSAQDHGVESVSYGQAEDSPLPVRMDARGLGYWAWKPALIAQRINVLPDGDILIYADAGVEFINNVNHIIDRMDQDIFLFGNNWEHAHWCKRDIVNEVWPSLAQSNHDAWLRFEKQAQASVIFFRVSDYSRKFVKEWLDWCLFEGGRLIDDSPSRTPNHPEFRENRHDQAILTTLAYREGIKLHYWPAMYNDGAFAYEKLAEYAQDDYPILFHHHRRRNHEWKQVA